MEDVLSDDSDIQVQVKRPFIGKFFKELNYRGVQKRLKSKRSFQDSPLRKHRTEKLKRSQVLNSAKEVVETLHNGHRIVAAWKDGQIHGEAQVYYSNGVVFKGRYSNGVKTKGNFKFLNGYEYTGQCMGNRFMGEGELRFPNGKIIIGQWHDYEVMGKAKIKYPMGEIYYGSVKAFKKHGHGYLFLVDGSKYEGEFEDGLITGHGTFYAVGEEPCEGEWQNGELVQEIKGSQQKQKPLSKTQLTLAKSFGIEDLDLSLLDEQTSQKTEILLKKPSQKKVRFS